MAMNRWERRWAAVCVVASVLLFFVGLSLYVIEGQISQSVIYSLLAALALLIAYGLLEPAAVRAALRSRRSGSSSLGLLMTAVVLGLLVMANVLAARGTQAIDLTQGGLNTLAPQSVLAARQLTADLQMVGLWRAGANSGQRDAEALIDLYAAQSPHVKYRAENVDTDATDVSRYGVRIPDTVVLDYRGRTELLTPGAQGEQEITSALIQLESDHVPLICWATGDGERDLAETNQSFGYSGLADLLTRNNFTTRDLQLSQASTVPVDCDVLAVVGPTHELSQASVAAVYAYAAGGGNLVLAAEPWQDPKVTASLNSIIKPLGPAFSGGLVLEPDPSRAAANDPTTPAVAAYGPSPISKDLQGAFAFFPQTTSITGSATVSVTAIPLAQTSATSYEVASPRRDFTRTDLDAPGPFTIMETLESPAGASKRARVVLVATAAFAENLAFASSNTDVNLQLSLATFQWLTGQDALIAIPPKASRNAPLVLTAHDKNLLTLITGFVLPALFVLGGVGVWWRRRPAA